jgi:hypothetical protein
MTETNIRTVYLNDILRTYSMYKSLGDRAFAQVADADLNTLVDPDGNSLAIIIKHVAGNLRSRFTDFLTADGEKPDRNRDGEFEMAAPASREQLLAWWNEGFAIVLGAIEGLVADDLDRTIRVRQEAFLVIEALNRSVAHTAYHVGQIVFLAKHLAGPAFTSLTIPKGKSAGVEGGYKNR